MKKKHSTLKLKGLLILCSILILTGCSKESSNNADSQVKEIESQKDEPIATTDEASVDTNKESAEPNNYIPDKEIVLRMREIALEGMTKEEIKRLEDNVKEEHLLLESGFIYNDLYNKLSDPKSLEWNYVDKVGEIQTGWAFESDVISQEESGLSKEEYEQTYGVPVRDNNDRNADSYIKLIDELSATIHNEDLKADMLTIKDLLVKVKETHDVEEIVKIHEILHDMDYFLLSYGVEEYGGYVKDQSSIGKYYGVLSIYQSEENKDAEIKSAQ